ncbi:MAG TPA: PDZ domain-containing protein [Candidatus Binatia bacterium]|nr:PDZ domain-containing protein [Candidatus Binatia bacterium]
MAEPVTVFVRAGDPVCAAALQYLDQRGVEHRVRDVLTDPSASAILLGRVGRVSVPAFQIGERLLLGFDPVQLARYLPRLEGESGPSVSFGAGVRTVTRSIASGRGLPATYGVEVGPVRDGSPAAVAGVRPGDIITAIGAYTLTGGESQFRTAVGARHPGDAMPITVWRDGASQELVVQFPAPEAEPAA